MIYFIRHGQTDWNLQKKIQGQLDISLNETGINEAKTCAKIIKGLKIDQIISSDLIRAYQTAEIINSQFNLLIKVDKRLREINFGMFQGKYIQEITPDMWNLFNNNSKEYKAESYEELYERMKQFITELDFNKNILVITHGGPIRSAMYFIEQKHPFDVKIYETQYKLLPLKNTAIFKWDTKSTRIEPFDGKQ